MSSSRVWLLPRDVGSAARTGAAFALVGALILVTLVSTVRSFTPTTATRVVALGIAATLLVQGTVLLRQPLRLPSAFWVSVPAQVVVLVTVLGVATRDASAAATTFFIWPVLYAAYELKARAAYAVLGLVVVGEAVVVFSVLPVDRAVNDLVCVGLSLAVLCAVLVRARESTAEVVAELERRAAVDPLTGLATRRVLDEAADASLRTGPDAVGVGTVLVLVDVDHFKAVNDRLGHPAGDSALVHVADLLRREFPMPAVVARLGGDELAVLIGAAAPSEVAAQADGFRRRLAAEPLEVLDELVPLTVSVGIAVGQHCALRELYAATDRALYAAKRSGRDRVSVDAPTSSPPGPDRSDAGRTYRRREQPPAAGQPVGTSGSARGRSS